MAMSSSPSSSEQARQFADEVGDAAARALDEERDRWHRCDASDACEVDTRMAARIVTEALLTLEADRDGGTRISPDRLAQLRQRLDRLQTLAEVVRQASVWDHMVYDETPDGQWLAMDREDYGLILDALASVDSWDPWGQPLERRLGDL